MKLKELIIASVIAVVVSLFLGDLRQTDTLREACYDSVTRQNEIIGFLRDAAIAREESMDFTTATKYRARANRIEITISKPCSEKYPYLIPFVE